MIVDFHTHNFPVDLAPRAIASMCDKLQGHLPPKGDGTVACQLAHMTAAGVDCAVVCPIATRPAQYGHILRRSIAVMNGEEGEEAARRLVYLASLHPDDPDFVAHAAEIAAAGIRGVVFHPYYQGFRLDDPAVFPRFEVLRDLGLFAYAHCGGDTGYPESPMTCGPCEIETLLKGVEGLTFVAAHLGGMNRNPPGCVDRLLPFERCFIDTAVLVDDQESDEAARIVRTWPAERMMYGTDYFWREEKPLVDWVRSRRPNAEELEWIFHRTAERLLGCAFPPGGV